MDKIFCDENKFFSLCSKFVAESITYRSCLTELWQNCKCSKSILLATTFCCKEVETAVFWICNWFVCSLQNPEKYATLPKLKSFLTWHNLVVVHHVQRTPYSTHGAICHVTLFASAVPLLRNKVTKATWRKDKSYLWSVKPVRPYASLCDAHAETSNRSSLETKKPSFIMALPQCSPFARTTAQVMTMCRIAWPFFFFPAYLYVRSFLFRSNAHTRAYVCH